MKIDDFDCKEKRKSLKSTTSVLLTDILDETVNEICEFLAWQWEHWIKFKSWESSVISQKKVHEVECFILSVMNQTEWCCYLESLMNMKKNQWREKKRKK